MTQYMISVWHREGDEMPSEQEMPKIFAAVDAVNAELQNAGKWVFGGGLEAPDTATVLKLSGDDVVTTDGPYAEAKEHVGGFWVIEAADLDEAMAWGKRCAQACRNVVEVRPFQAE